MNRLHPKTFFIYGSHSARLLTVSLAAALKVLKKSARKLLSSSESARFAEVLAKTLLKTEAYEAVDFHRGLGSLGAHSAASMAVVMRRLCSDNSRYFSCHLLGPLEVDTCTAVTLYSGQLVAQSELSVVMTLACVIG